MTAANYIHRAVCVFKRVQYRTRKHTHASHLHVAVQNINYASRGLPILYELFSTYTNVRAYIRTANTRCGAINNVTKSRHMLRRF